VPDGISIYYLWIQVGLLIGCDYAMHKNVKRKSLDIYQLENKNKLILP